jgi:hypothetical protein
VTNLLRCTTVNVAVGNADAHAKNFSILHDADSPAIRLAPLYDVADIRKVTTASLVDEAAAWGIRRRAAASVITETLDRVLAAIGDIPPGRKPGRSAATSADAGLALVGYNGAGRSTLVKLVCRFYDPDHGRILWDGTDVRDVRSRPRHPAQAARSAAFPAGSRIRGECT